METGEFGPWTAAFGALRKMVDDGAISAQEGAALAGFIALDGRGQSQATRYRRLARLSELGISS